jgi:hypothetical protein
MTAENKYRQKLGGPLRASHSVMKNCLLLYLTFLSLGISAPTARIISPLVIDNLLNASSVLTAAHSIVAERSELFDDGQLIDATPIAFTAVILHSNTVIEYVLSRILVEQTIKKNANPFAEKKVTSKFHILMSRTKYQGIEKWELCEALDHVGEKKFDGIAIAKVTAESGLSSPYDTWSFMCNWGGLGRNKISPLWDNHLLIHLSVFTAGWGQMMKREFKKSDLDSLQALGVAVE